MSTLKRAICTKCNPKNDKHRFFEVNPEAPLCYCPHCMAQLDPQMAVYAYDNYIAKKLEKAYKTLYEITDFNQAYILFANIIEIDGDVIEARFGRLLSLIYLSKLRRERFSDAVMILKEESKLYFHKVKAIGEYAKFLLQADAAVDEYNRIFRKRLSIRTYYYDDECIKLMYRRIKDIGEFKQYLIEEAKFVLEKNESQEMKDLISKLEEEVSRKAEELNKKVIGVDGFTYGLAGFTPTGTAVLGHNSSPEQIKVKYFRRRTLGNSDRKTSLIADDVFPDNTKLYYFIKCLLPWDIVAGIVTITALIVAFFVFKPGFYKIISYTVAGLNLSLLVFFVIYQILGSNKLKKRRDNLLKRNNIK